MSLKAIRTAVRLNRLCRAYSQSSHYTLLPSDTYEGTLVTKRLTEKGRLPPPSYGGRLLVTMLPGDDPGPKLMEYVQDVFNTAVVPIDFDIITSISPEERTEEYVDEYNRHALLSLKRNGVGIKGNIPRPQHHTEVVSSNVTIRTELDLFVCLVRCRGYKGIACKHPNLDVCIARQNTEGEYCMLEHQSKPGVVESLKVITRENTERLARWTFEFARREGRKKVTIVHKANIMKLSDGLFMNTVKNVAKGYPEITVDDMIVDNCTMQLVTRPENFDVLITPNLYGNILSNLLCGLIGGPGLMAGGNYGAEYALFEAASRHLSYEDMDLVSPVCMLNAAVGLLHYVGKHDHARVIDEAITKTINVNKIHTADIGGCNTADDLVDCVKDNIKEIMKSGADLCPF